MNKYTLFYLLESGLLTMRFAAGKSQIEQPKEIDRWYAGYNLILHDNKKYISIYFSFEDRRASLQLACMTRQQFREFLFFLETLSGREDMGAAKTALITFKDDAYPDKWVTFEDSHQLTDANWAYLLKQLQRLPHKELLATVPGYFFGCLD